MALPFSRERLLLPIMVICAAVIALLLALRHEGAVARERVLYEDLALERVRRVADAQRAFHEREGRYGWVAELEAAGLLRGLVLEDRAGHPAVTSPRYRIDVLLPTLLAPGEVVRIVTRDQGDADTALVQEHFAVVARPWGEALTGFRTWYIDNHHLVHISEGVSDVPSRTRRPLPEVLLTRGAPRDVTGLRWWRSDQLPPK
jgi:hypothetical protein